LTNNLFFDKKTDKYDMKYEDKTKKQLINESAQLHRGIEGLEAKATKRKKAEIVSNVYLVDHKRSHKGQ